MQECDSAPDYVLQTVVTCKPWRGASCCTAVLLQRLCPGAGGPLLPALLALQSWLVSSEYGKGTKAALLLAERAIQMFGILPELTSQMGEAAPAPNSLISARQREKKGAACSRVGATGELSGAEGVVCSVTGLGFIPKHPPNLQIGAAENLDLELCLFFLCVYFGVIVSFATVF